MGTKYMLRKAAGSYWLLDMEQDGKQYKEPIELNESGAIIWDLVCKGREELAVAEYIAEQYGIGLAEAKEDVRQFLAGLEAAGIS